MFGTDPYDHQIEDLREPLELALRLRDAGVSLLNVTAGNPYVNPHVVRPADYPPIDGYDAPEHPLLGVLRHFRLARAVQAAVPDLPVVGSGYSWLQEFALQAAAANVTDGSVAIVGLGPCDVGAARFRANLQGARRSRSFSNLPHLLVLHQPDAQPAFIPRANFQRVVRRSTRKSTGRSGKKLERKLPPGDSLCP